MSAICPNDPSWQAASGARAGDPNTRNALRPRGVSAVLAARTRRPNPP
ncbi:hypothetical protein DO73_3181 [Burkholderia pseudomallei]|nr:hypothetical protein DO73_3181 [Burkholderia pseudomallei]